MLPEELPCLRRSTFERFVSLATDLNRRPADYKSAALPTELARHYGGVSSKAAVIVLIFHLPLDLDIVSNGPAYIRDVLGSQRLYGAGGRDFHPHGVLFGHSTTLEQVRLNATRQ